MKYNFVKELNTKSVYDVIIIGGGTAGVVAALASARTGAKTLLVERTGSLGGMMTLGNCGLTCFILHASNVKDQYKVEEMLSHSPEKAQVIGGIPMEITKRLIEDSKAIATEGNAGSYVFTEQAAFKMLLNEMITDSGANVLFHTSFVDVVMENSEVKGVVLHNKGGLSLYEGKTFIDASGDGDLAAASGAEYFVGIGKYDLVYKENPSLLGQVGAMGVMFRIGSTNILKTLEYLNKRTEPHQFEIQIMSLQDYKTVLECIRSQQMTTFVIKGFSFGGLQIYNTPDPEIFVLGCPCINGNGLDAYDKSRAETEISSMIKNWMKEICAVPGFENSVVLDIPEIGIRETRHIIGDHILGLKEILNMHIFEDSIGKGSHLIDITPVPSWLKKDELPEMFEFTMPYRSLIVKGIDNMFVAGRCLSATHEASGTIRVTVQCMVSGEAAGTAAAMCANNGGASRGVPYEKIKEKLLENGVIL